MHVIPAVGLLSALIIGREKRLPVHLFSAAFVALVVFTFVQALIGLPFLPTIG